MSILACFLIRLRVCTKRIMITNRTPMMPIHKLRTAYSMNFSLFSKIWKINLTSKTSVTFSVAPVFVRPLVTVNWIVVNLNCKGWWNLQALLSVLQLVMKVFTVGDETYIGTCRTVPVSLITDCKSYATKILNRSNVTKELLPLRKSTVFIQSLTKPNMPSSDPFPLFSPGTIVMHSSVLFLAVSAKDSNIKRLQKPVL